MFKPWIIILKSIAQLVPIDYGVEVLNVHCIKLL